MTASAEWTPRRGPLSFAPLRVTVHRYKPEHEGEEYEYLPNVRCESIAFREGANPPTARFAYVADDRARAAGWPCDFESILRLSQKRPARGSESPETAERYIVRPGSRIVVLGASEGDREGTPPRVLFDGFARSPQANVGPRSQAAGFDAAGVAERLWDEPIHRVVLRDAGSPESTSDIDNRWTSIPARINPDHRSSGLSLVSGNCTVDGADMPTRKDGEGEDSDEEDPEEDPIGWPCFVDATYAYKSDETPSPAPWTLGRLVRYLMWAHNGRYGQDQEYVSNPHPSWLSDMLEAKRPLEGKATFDPNDPSTYELSPIVLPEMDLTGKAWPDAMNSLLAHYGFAMNFTIDSDDAGLPSNRLEVYRKDGSGRFEPKSIPFQQARSVLDTNKTQVSAMSLGRDFGAVFNGVIVDTQRELYEVAVVLLPGFKVAEADDATPDAFRAANLARADAETRLKYRLWVCEEVYGLTTPFAAGRYTPGAASVHRVLDCFKIWPNDTDDKSAQESRRRRPGRTLLLSRDLLGKPLKSFLSLSKDYSGPTNALWDGTGAWQDVAGSNGWRLLPDRLGVMIDCDDPNAWSIGSKAGAVVGQAGIVKLVTATAKPNEANPALLMRLTTVIEGDAKVAKPLPRRTTSPLKSTRYRIVDARESFGRHLVHVSSPYFEDPKAAAGELNEAEDAVIVRDDAGKAAAYGAQVQQASENPPIAGTVTIPWHISAYEIGDQIKEIAGRDLSLQVNAATEAGESPRYPYVVGVDYGFGEGGQSTVLHLSDKIAEPAEEGVTQ